MGLLALIKSFLFAPEPPPSGEPTGWSVFSVGNGGVSALVCIRTEEPVLPEGARFPFAVQMEWQFAEDGMPTKEQFQDVYAFERLTIDKLSEENDRAMQLRIRTGFGKREWLFYAEDAERFTARLNELIAQAPPLSITIAVLAEPDWSTWRTSLAELVSAEARSAR
jgi:hypothetical protein